MLYFYQYFLFLFFYYYFFLHEIIFIVAIIASTLSKNKTNENKGQCLYFFWCSVKKHSYTDVHKWNLTPGVSEIAYYDAVILCQKINMAPMGDYQSVIIHSQRKNWVRACTQHWDGFAIMFAIVTHVYRTRDKSDTVVKFLPQTCLTFIQTMILVAFEQCYQLWNKKSLTLLSDWPSYTSRWDRKG